MITAAVPSFWGSSLEDPARSSSFAVAEVPELGLNESAGLQFAAFSLNGPQDVFGTEELPSIDESLFDLVEVPELEEVDVNERNPLVVVAPQDDLMFEEIPPLEDPGLDEPVLTNDQQWLDWTQTKPQESSLVQPWETQKVTPAPKVPSPSILVTDDTLFEKEEIVSSSPVAVYVDSCGSESPLSCYSMVSDEFVAPPAEKRRRVSQISMSSYCSSNGDSTWSPTSASDSDVDSRRGGRKSRFSPEDRKERKKAQNRTAAERYRQKRKVQEETIDEEEQQLIDGNTELKTEVTKLQAEVSCLKRLMREMLQAKGVIIPPKKKATPN